MKRDSFLVLKDECACCRVEKAETPPPDDHFIKEELALAALLLLAWNNVVAQFGIVQRIIDAAKSHSHQIVNEAIWSSSTDVQNFYDAANLAPDTNLVLDKTNREGAKLVGALALLYLYASRTEHTLSLYQQHVAYYANNYFARIVRPDLLSIVDKHFNLGGGAEALENSLRKAMGTLVTGTDNYWKIVANQTVSRAHHYGILNGAQAVGYRAYRFVAVIDERTTPLCRYLNGREWWIATGIEFLERVAATDPELVPDVAPWLPFKDIDGKDNAELSRLGVMIPPLHALCRSTIVAVW